MIRNTKLRKKIDKEKLGPGVYYNGAESALKKNSPNMNKNFVIPKSNSPNAVSLRAHLTRLIPPVGFYKNIDLAYTKNIIFKKNRSPVITPYKIKSQLDELQKISATIPGPGSYNIGPPIRKNKKYG